LGPAGHSCTQPVPGAGLEVCRGADGAQRCEASHYNLCNSREVLRHWRKVKTMAESEGARRNSGKLKAEQIPPNPQERDGPRPPGHAVVQVQVVAGGSRRDLPGGSGTRPTCLSAFAGALGWAQGKCDGHHLSRPLEVSDMVPCGAHADRGGQCGQEKGRRARPRAAVRKPLLGIKANVSAQQQCSNPGAEHRGEPPFDAVSPKATFSTWKPAPLSPAPGIWVDSR